MKIKKQYKNGGVVRETFYADDGSIVKERLHEKTPQGGNYSECYYVDGKPREICEFSADGTMICSTYCSPI